MEETVNREAFVGQPLLSGSNRGGGRAVGETGGVGRFEASGARAGSGTTVLTAAPIGSTGIAHSPPTRSIPSQHRASDSKCTASLA